MAKRFAVGSGDSVVPDNTGYNPFIVQSNRSNPFIAESQRSNPFTDSSASASVEKCDQDGQGLAERQRQEREEGRAAAAENCQHDQEQLNLVSSNSFIKPDGDELAKRQRDQREEFESRELEGAAEKGPKHVSFSKEVSQTLRLSILKAI